jgi:mRNA-degrading endonuclease toxin of MazEF toxin-antitoxin module
MRLRFVAGTILRVSDVPDMAGTRPKNRPVVIVQAIDADPEDEEACLLGVAITTKFERPVAPPCVELEFAPPGRCGTGLVDESVAQCDWLVDRPLSAIIERIGYVGDKALRDIMNILRERFGKRPTD